MKQVEQQKQEPIQEQQKPGKQVLQNEQVNLQTGEQPIKKKSKWWLWLIIALIVIGAGVYFFNKYFGLF